jgi:hypothetical protein
VLLEREGFVRSYLEKLCARSRLPRAWRHSTRLVDDEHIRGGLVEARRDSCQRPGRQSVRRRDEPDVVAGRGVQREVQGLAEAHGVVEVVHHETVVPLGEFVEDLRPVVRRRVVDRDELDVSKRLVEYR